MNLTAAHALIKILSGVFLFKLLIVPILYEYSLSLNLFAIVEVLIDRLLNSNSNFFLMSLQLYNISLSLTYSNILFVISLLVFVF